MFLQSFLFLCFFLFSLPLLGMGTHKSIGIEIETSALKICSPSPEKMGFIIFHPEPRKDLWMIEEDTADATFKGKQYEEFSLNLECKTVGGFSSREEFLEIVLDIQKILQDIYNRSKQGPMEVTPDYILSVIQKGNIHAREKIASQGGFLVKAKAGDDQKVRPQITYKLPLECIPRVFQHLSELGHPSVGVFLKILNPGVDLGVTVETIQKNLGSTIPMQKIVGNGQKLQLFLRENVSRPLSELEEGRVKGFCYLFLYYWYEIFNNKERIGGLEPGPKQFLAIMSRVPLSQIYETLSDDEKQAIHELIGEILEHHGTDYRIRGYENYERHPVNFPLNIKQWYDSIVSPVQSGQKVGERYIDLLSPPPGLIRTPDKTPFSMGVMDIVDTGEIPLIEVRGYANIKHGGDFLTLSNVGSFVDEETSWFFSHF